MALESDGHLIERFRTIMFLPLVVPSPRDRNATKRTEFYRERTRELLKALQSVTGDGRHWHEIADKLDHLDPTPSRTESRQSRKKKTCAGQAKGEGDTSPGEDRASDEPSPPAKAGSPADSTFHERMQYQEFIYFHGFIQKLLFGQREAGDCAATEDLRIFRRTDVQKVRITTARGDQDNPASFEATLTCERFNLYVFPIGVAIVCVELSGGDTGVIADTPTTLTHALAIQNAVRRIYPPYFTFSGETLELREFPTHIAFIGADGKALAEENIPPAGWMARVMGTKDGKAVRRCNPLSGAWREMLRPLCIEGDPAGPRDALAWRQVVDERMPCMTFISSPTAGKWTDGQWLRLVYLDQPGDGFAYNSQFEPDWQQRYCYDRHWYGGYGTRYLISSYSFLCVGVPYQDLFPTIIEQHFRRMYADMMLLNQFQFAALLALSNWISDAVPEPDPTPAEAEAQRVKLRDEVKELRAIYISFVQRFWFTNISNQIQARELYAKIRAHIGTEALYQEVSRQLADVNEYLEAEEQADQSDAAAKLNVLAGVGLGASVALSALALFGDKVPWFGKFNAEPPPAPRPAGWMVDTSLTLAAIGVAYVLLAWLLRAMAPRQAGRATQRFISLLIKLVGILTASAALLFLAWLMLYPA